MNKEELKSYSFLLQYRKLEKLLSSEADELSKERIKLQLNIIKKKIIPAAYDIERNVKYWEDKIQELKAMREISEAQRGEIRDEIKKCEKEIFNLTHVGR